MLFRSILNSLTASQILALDGSSNVQSLSTSTYPSLTELSYVKGVTSGIQTQLNNKFNTSGGTLSGGLTATTISATTYQNLPSQSGTGVSSLSYSTSTGILTLTKNDTTTLTAGTFTYLTGVTYSNNILTFTNNLGSTSTAVINTVTGLKIGRAHV